MKLSLTEIKKFVAVATIKELRECSALINERLRESDDYEILKSFIKIAAVEIGYPISTPQITAHVRSKNAKREQDAYMEFIAHRFANRRHIRTAVHKLTADVFAEFMKRSGMRITPITMCKLLPEIDSVYAEVVPEWMNAGLSDWLVKC